eukprot:GHVS01081042.1.p1 GENE.GHVS01081042.1~~GHVS01081042.1.p1  ORF type:complete len:677 (-),score=148.90 GHVS01081042.1:158-1915(-)
MCSICSPADLLPCGGPLLLAANQRLRSKFSNSPPLLPSSSCAPRPPQERLIQSAPKRRRRRRRIPTLSSLPFAVNRSSTEPSTCCSSSMEPSTTSSPPSLTAAYEKTLESFCRDETTPLLDETTPLVLLHLENNHQTFGCAIASSSPTCTFRSPSPPPSGPSTCSLLSPASPSTSPCLLPACPSSSLWPRHRPASASHWLPFFFAPSKGGTCSSSCASLFPVLLVPPQAQCQQAQCQQAQCQQAHCQRAQCHASTYSVSPLMNVEVVVVAAATEGISSCASLRMLDIDVEVEDEEYMDEEDIPQGGAVAMLAEQNGCASRRRLQSLSSEPRRAERKGAGRIRGLSRWSELKRHKQKMKQAYEKLKGGLHANALIKIKERRLQEETQEHGRQKRLLLMSSSSNVEESFIDAVIHREGIFKQPLGSLTAEQREVIYCECLRRRLVAPVHLTETSTKGRAVLAADKIFKHDFCMEYEGDLVSETEAGRREKIYDKAKKLHGSFIFYMRSGPSGRCAVDATDEFKGYGPGRLVNHSRRMCNLKAKSLKADGFRRLFFVAKKDIASGDELLIDYGETNSETLAKNPWLRE